MQLRRATLDEAATQGLLSPDQARALWDWLALQQQEAPAFRPAHILYYLGGLIAIGAMTLFMNLGWERFGGGGLLLVSLAYAAGALVLTQVLLRRRLPLPAGITATLAVVMVPLGVYGAQHLLGLWDGHGMAYRDYHLLVDWRWLFMELATLIAGTVAVWHYRLPFLVMPIAVTLWYLGMDLRPFLFGGDETGYGAYLSDEGLRVSAVYGLMVTVLAVWVDVRARATQDFAFWLYLAGVLTFWGALSAMHSGSEWAQLGYAAINLGLIAVGAALARRVFAVVGGLGLAGYLGHLSYQVFRDSLLFPFALTALGLGVIAAGVLWQRHEAALGARLRGLLPPALVQGLARRAGS